MTLNEYTTAMIEKSTRKAAVAVEREGQNKLVVERKVQVNRRT